jgi:hypothetical protein
MAPKKLPEFTPIPLARRRGPFDDDRWLFERKYDGFRALPYVLGDKAKLVSRTSCGPTTATYNRFDDDPSGFAGTQLGHLTSSVEGVDELRTG